MCGIDRIQTNTDILFILKILQSCKTQTHTNHFASFSLRFLRCSAMSTRIRWVIEQ